MENVRKYLPIIIGGIVGVAVFLLSRKMRKSEQANSERSNILEKAREAKLAKSILKNIDDDSQSITN